jgi:hypothetical protein
MRSRRAICVLGLAMGALLVPARARGEKSADAARAEALFAEGRKLMAAHDFASACVKFADSQRLDPAPGTALNLATCYERAGKLASAWAAFKTAEASAENAGQRGRAAAAKKEATALEAKLSRLTILVPFSARVTGLEVRCDQEIVHEGEWGVAVPRDGGAHEIEASAPGKRAWNSHIDLKDSRQTLEVSVPPLEDEPTPAPIASSAPSPPAGSEGPAPAPAAGGQAATEPPERRGRTQRTIALGVGGLGVAGLAFGVVAGIEAMSSYSDARSACGQSVPQCSAGSAASAFGLHDRTITWATASTIGLAAGGAVLAAGAVLFFTAPKGEAGPAVGIAPTSQGATVSLRGAF